MRKPLAALTAVFLLAACDPAPLPASPALWEVRGDNGERAWLFGTVHALEQPVEWRSGAIASALGSSDSVVVEVRDVADGAAMAETFSTLARTTDHGPLSARVQPGLRPALIRLLGKANASDAGFADMETWAAAIVLARAATPGPEERHGIDRAVIAAADKRPVIELEGAAGQLAIFDSLPEAEQRDMLALVIADAQSAGSGDADLAEAWRTGNFAAIEAETRQGLLADPELRAALFTRRNAAWTARIDAMVRQGRRPFVAVGAAHMAGPDGLPAMLARRGHAVRRVQ